MPIDIYYCKEDGEQELALQLHDDGHYGFLHPWFVRLHKSIGKFIDLYGVVEMHKDSGLVALAQTLAEAKSEAERQPREWQVHVGTQMRPIRKELYDTVRRADLLQIISQFQIAVDSALQQDIKLIFLGD